MPSQPIKISTFNDPIYEENGMIMSVESGKSCWIIDPGLPPQAEQMLQHLSEHDLSPVAVILTHAHADHFAGLNELRRQIPDLPVYLAREEWHFLEDPMENLSGRFGLPLLASTDNVQDLSVGLELELEQTHWKSLDTSGHSPGGRAIYCAEHGLAIVGDAIFAGGIGRTDFHYSDHDRFMANLRANLMSLPDETIVVPGHGPNTTIGQERQTNSFLRTS